MTKTKIAEIVLSKEDSKILVDELLNPREPGDKLKEAVERYKEQWIRTMAEAEDKAIQNGGVTAGNMACRPHLQHAKPCGITESDSECACGCSGDDVWCMAEKGMPTVECKAAIFGLNALCDIEEIVFRGLNSALMEHGWSIPEDQKADYAGMPIAVRLSLLSEKDHLPLTLHEWIERRAEVFIKRRVGELKLEEPKLGLFQSLKKRDIKIAVYTTTSRESLKLALTNLGIMGLVDAWLGKEDVELMPPDPAIFEKALEQLGVDARACVVVDSLYSSWVAAREKHFAMVVEIDSAKDVTEVLF